MSGRPLSRARLGWWTAALPLLAAIAGPADAFTGGASGFSGKGGGATCAQCHSGGKEPTVEVKGPATLSAGETGSYVVVITGASAKATIFAGLGVAASGGELKARAKGTVVKDGEVVQTALAGPGNPIEFKFDWVAPPGGGAATLFAAGLASDGSGGTSGDATKAAQLQVTVQVPPDLAKPPEDLAGADLLGLDLAVPPDLAVSPDLTPPPEEPPPADLAVHRPDEPRWGCGCALGGRASPPPILLYFWLGTVLSFVSFRVRTRLAR